MKIHNSFFGVFLALFMCVAFLSTANLVHADEDDRLEIEVEAGLNGKAKQQVGLPVTLTITNNKADFAGDLVITLPLDYSTVVNKVIPVNIAADTSKTIQFTVRSLEGIDALQQNPNQNVQQFRLYEGDWKLSKEVEISNSLRISPNFVQGDKAVIGVLSDRPDSLNYLKLMTFRRGDPEVIFLDANALPEAATGLEVLDMLVINDFSIAALPENVQIAIQQWVNKGGHLVIGSEPGLNQQVGTLQTMLPVNITGEQAVQVLDGYGEAAEVPLQLDNFELYTGDLATGATVLHAQNDIPLVAERESGQGVVTQFTYDIGHPAFVDWQGNQEVWSSLTSGLANSVSNNYNMYDQIEDTLARISSRFPSLANFKVSTLSIAFIIYLIVIVPIVYIVLRKMDKREWAWIVIPALAIISSIGLYTVGAKDRLGEIKTNAVSVIAVNQSGIGSGYGAVSLLSRGAGTYTLTTDTALNPLATQGDYNRVDSLSNLPIVEPNGEQTDVRFQQVEFWSPRNVTLEYPTQQYGHFATNLSIANNQVGGQITNNFAYDFEEIYLISGRDYQEIGPLAAGESVDVSFDAVQSRLFIKPYQDIAYKLYGQPGMINQSAADEQLKSELLSSAINNNMFAGSEAPYLVAITSHSLQDVQVNGRDTEETNLHLFTQPVTVELPENESVSLATELQTPDLSVVEGNIYHNGMGEEQPFFDAESGLYQLTYRIPKAFAERGLQVNKLEVNLQQMYSERGVMYSIYNRQTDSYEPVDQTGLVIDQNVHANYIADNEIVIQVELMAQAPVDVPIVTVEGVTNP
ncbi:hypothetical protein [Radiobacillus sp. PE A8.2]|uniref:hypothetical protein n=1 Tax=Radiobacillus sp. PE A8.2 TaxID=3380349 RepID=UPI0038910DFA